VSSKHLRSGSQAFDRVPWLDFSGTRARIPTPSGTGSIEAALAPVCA
jgi:hypothetical protein